MSLLVDKLKKDFGNIWNQSNNFAFQTGFTVIDIMSSSMERGASSGGDYNFMNGGLFCKPYTFTGKSGTGKSSLAIQLQTAAVDYCTRRFGPYVDFVMFDVEKHTTLERIRELSKWNDVEIYNRLHFVQQKVSIEEIFNEIQRICSKKEKMKDESYIEFPILNLDGSAFHHYYPTFVLIDSIAALREYKEMEYDKAGELKENKSIVENIDAMRAAKKNTAFIMQIKNLCMDYNIHIGMINHIETEASMDMFSKPSRNLLHLKAGERLKGGNELIFQSAFMINLTYGKRIDDNDPIYGPYVRGAINKVTYLKNKNGKEGLLFPMVFDSDKGYMPELSDFETLLEFKYGISGTSVYTLDILPEYKLTRKNVLEICYDNPIVARAIQFTSRALLNSLLVYNDEPLNIAQLVEGLSLEDRMNLILHYSIDYPGYINMGLVVTPELIEQTLKSNMRFTEALGNALNDLVRLKIDLHKMGYEMQDHQYSLDDIVKNPNAEYLPFFD